MAQFQDLWSVVNIVKKDYEERTDEHSLTYLHYGQQELRELILAGLHDAIMYTTVLLPVEDDGQSVILPPDYSSWMKVSAYHCGRGFNLDHNPNILAPQPHCCNIDDFCSEWDSFQNNAQTGSATGRYGWYYSGFVHNGQVVAGMYGAGAGFNNGSFREDLPHGRLLLHENCRGRIKQVIMDYRSNGAGYGQNGIVTDNLLNALRWGVHWQIQEFLLIKGKSTEGTVARLAKQRKIGWDRVLARKASDFNVETLLGIYRQSIIGVPKR